MAQDNRPNDEPQDEALCYDDPTTASGVAAPVPALPAPTPATDRRQAPWTGLLTTEYEIIIPRGPVRHPAAPLRCATAWRG